MRLSDRIAEARANLERLEREAAGASCAELGHDWKFIGGAHCGCTEIGARGRDLVCVGCSVPVHECARCGDCDYGENDEAVEVRAECTANSRDGG